MYLQGFFDNAVGTGKGATAVSAMAMSVDDAGDIAGDGWGDEDEEEGDVELAVDGEKITTKKYIYCEGISNMFNQKYREHFGRSQSETHKLHEEFMTEMSLRQQHNLPHFEVPRKTSGE